MRKTPLNAVHHESGATMIDFGGWEMPVYYGTITEEHLNVRAKCGLFDLCHMGRYVVFGEKRLEYVDKLLTNKMTDLPVGGARYSLMCNDNAAIIDDVIVYALPDYALVVVNAGNRDKDWAHMKGFTQAFGVKLEDWSDKWCMVALQGPESENILKAHTQADLTNLGYYKVTTGKLFGLDMVIARTGYTGEDGFELYFDSAHSAAVWNKLLEIGKAKGLRPVGLGARDTLRLEAGMALYGHEIDDSTNPLEAGLSWAVKLKKDDFVGKTALEKIKTAGSARKLVGFRVESKRVARQGAEIYAGNEKIGFVCSGAPSPTLGMNIGTAYVSSAHAETGSSLEVDIRGSRVGITVIDKPFYKRGK